MTWGSGFQQAGWLGSLDPVRAQTAVGLEEGGGPPGGSRRAMGTEDRGGPPGGSGRDGRAEESGDEELRAASRSPLRLLLVDDHEVILDGIVAMLRRHAGRAVVEGVARTVPEALRSAATLVPDVVLTDVRLKGESGLDLCRVLVERHPDLAVVFFTVYDDEQYLFQALRAGARGFLLKHTGGADLVAHLERAVEGETVVDPTLAGRVALSAARMHAGEFWPGAHLGLTQRESEVLELAIRGLSNRAIAGRLVVGEETVKTHLSSIYRKLGARDRATAVAAALREGLFH